jgi:hypothetical protein
MVATTYTHVVTSVHRLASTFLGRRWPFAVHLGTQQAGAGI